jgi:hypothetical protein
MEVRSFLKQVRAKAKQNGELHFLFSLTADVKACTHHARVIHNLINGGGRLFLRYGDRRKMKVK